MNRTLLATLILVFYSVLAPASANPYGPGPYGGYPEQVRIDKAVSNNPAAIVRAGIGKLQNFIKSGSAGDRQRALNFMTTEIEPYFDFDYMTRWAAGPAWRELSPQQRADIRNQIRNTFMNTLAQQLVTYNNQRIRYFTPRGQGRNEVRVRADILQPSGIPTRLEFRFYRTGGDWKIFDVKANGNSAVVHYRARFRSSFHPPYGGPGY